MKRQRTGKGRIPLAVLALMWLTLSTNAQDVPPSAGLEGLLIAPTRIVLGPRGRAGELTLVNRSAETVTYRISMVNLRMTEDGQLIGIPADEPVPFAADRMIIMWPP